MSQNSTQQQPNYSHPLWQFCHKVYYNGSLNERLKGQRMTIGIKPTLTSNIFVVSHAIVSPKDNFSKRVGRTICMNRIIKHLDMLNTRIDYNFSNEYNIHTPTEENKLMLQVRQYPYADTVTVSADIDAREQMDTIAFMFQEGAYLY